jgi:hypothetical protein
MINALLLGGPRSGEIQALKYPTPKLQMTFPPSQDADRTHYHLERVIEVEEPVPEQVAIYTYQSEWESDAVIRGLVKVIGEFAASVSE